MANITMEEALEIGRQPSLPEFISPNTFNPAANNPVEFLRAYERTAISNGWNNLHKLSFFEIYLEGAAHIWFTKYKSEPLNANKTWENVKSDLIERFGGGEYWLRKLSYRFNARRQEEGEDIKAYYYDLLTLAHEVDPKMREETLDRFEAGLHPILFERYFKKQANMNMEELERAVLRISEMLERQSMKLYK